jgi:hypothetical protein
MNKYIKMLHEQKMKKIGGIVEKVEAPKPKKTRKKKANDND